MTNKKNLINVGDSVVFAQRYLFNDNELYNKTGKVTEMKKNKAIVNFEKIGETAVNITDLELLSTFSGAFEQYFENIEDVEFAHSHELGGCQRSQLIAESLQAQEYDPRRSNEIRHMLANV